MHKIHLFCFSHEEPQKTFWHFGEIDLFNGGEKYARQGPGTCPAYFSPHLKEQIHTEVLDHFLQLSIRGTQNLIIVHELRITL